MISVTEPIGPAMEWMKKMLFQPFNMAKWFALGFCAFLANLGGGGGLNSRVGNSMGRNAGGGNEAFQEISTWVAAHLPLVIALSVALLVLIVALGLLLTWLSSRGQFMFLDGVVHDRADVVAPWRRFRALANHLFIFRIVLGFSGLAALLLIGLLGWLIARPDIAARQFGAAALTAVLFGGVLMLITVVVLAVVELLLHDFVVPIMYRRGIPTVEAFGVLWRDILPGNGWTLVLFYLMKCVLGLASVVVVLLGTCLTCCLAALPYISSVVFLPVFVFFRAYSLYFLEQFGEEWRLIGLPWSQRDHEAEVH